MNVPERDFKLHCDERQITQVMTNVLKNAAESVETRLMSRPDEKGCIRIMLSRQGGTIELVIEDNGTGFPPGEAQKMLEPYVTTRTKGTGLGLAIVRKIIEDHKGQINLENIPAGGARVRLSFLQQCDI